MISGTYYCREYPCGAIAQHKVRVRFFTRRQFGNGTGSSFGGATSPLRKILQIIFYIRLVHYPGHVLTKTPHFSGAFRNHISHTQRRAVIPFDAELAFFNLVAVTGGLPHTCNLRWVRQMAVIARTSDSDAWRGVGFGVVALQHVRTIFRRQS